MKARVVKISNVVMPNMSVLPWNRPGFSRDQATSDMSSKTKDFIQKICYKRTASVDMTQFGFINDTKLHPVNMLLKPLRKQLEKICGKTNCHMVTRKTSPIKCTVKYTNITKKHGKKRKGKTQDKKEVVVRTEDLIAKRLQKRAADATYENNYNFNKHQIHK